MRADDKADQTTVLGKMIQQKLEELRQLDGRIEKRLEHLSRTEQNLRLLFDSLRAQVIQAHPLIGQLNQLRQNNADMLETLVEQVQKKIQSNMPAPVRTESVEVVSSSPLVDAQAIERTTRQAIDTINSRATRVDDDIDAMVQTAKNFIDHALANATKSAEAMFAQIDSRLTEVQQAAAAVPQLNKLEAARQSSDADLESAVTAFSAQAEATMESIRRSTQQHVEQISAEAKMEIRPMLAKIQDQKRAAEEQLATAVESAERELAGRAEQLRRNAEKMVEMCERQLIDRIANVRPRTRSTIETLEHAANQRVAKALEEMSSAVQQSEQQAMYRIESLRPRFSELLHQLEGDIQEQLKRMEDDAMASVHWLEHRMGRRVDELTQQVGKTLTGEIEKVDEAITPSRKRPASPVSVQVMVDSKMTEQAA